VECGLFVVYLFAALELYQIVVAIQLGWVPLIVALIIAYIPALGFFGLSIKGQMIGNRTSAGRKF